MSDNLQLAITLNTHDVSNTPIFHENITNLKNEHLILEGGHNVNLNEDIVSSLTTNWYQKDLAHMTTNLMKVETNPATTALSTSLSPNLMSRSYSLNEDVYGGYYPNNWGGIDLSGLGNFYGDDGGYRNRPDVIKLEKARAKDSSKDIFHNVYGRDPTAKEWDQAAAAVFGYTDKDFNTRYNALQKKLAYTKEGHDRIANIGVDVLGYVPSEELIKQEQVKLAVYGSTQQNIRNDFAYSQVAHDQYINMSKNMLGYNANEATIRNMQDQAANGNKYTDIKRNFSNSQAVTDAISKVGSDILGRTVNIQTDHDWIEGQRQELFNNKSIDQIYYDQAHGVLGDAAANEIFKNLLGRDATAGDTSWKNGIKDQLGSKKSYMQVRYDQAHGFLGDAVANEIFKNLLGRDATAGDTSWKNGIKDQLGSNQTYAQVRYDQAHGFLGDAVANEILKNLLGRDATAGDTSWKNGIKDQLGSNQTYAQVRYDQAHGFLGDAVANEIFKNLLGRDATAGDTSWKNGIKDQLGSNQTYAQVRYNQAHGFLGDAVANEILKNLLGRDATAGDTSWKNGIKDQLGSNQTYAQVRYDQAHGFLGDAVANEILKNLLGRDATAGDTSWKNGIKDQLGSNQTYAQVRYDQAHGFLGEYASNEIFTTITGHNTTAADIGWKNAMKAGLGNGMSYNQILHQETYGFLGTSMVQKMAQQKNLQLSQTAIKSQQNLIEKQGFVKTQQQFNQVADVYHNIAGSNDIIFVDKFVNYQQLGSNKEISKAIYKDLVHTIDPSFKVNLVDDNGQIVYGANKQPAQIPVSFYEKITDIIQQGLWIKTLNNSFPITGQVIPQDSFEHVVQGYNLYQFRRNGTWDVQRLYTKPGTIDHDLRDVSTINIGIYAAASGMSLNDILVIENTYARTSNFIGEEMSKQYSHLAQRNVDNTIIGYNLYKNGLITGAY